MNWPGHGMDGIGGSLKRNAGQNVVHGRAISCAKDLVELFTSSKTKVVEVRPTEIETHKKIDPRQISCCQRNHRPKASNLVSKHWVAGANDVVLSV